MRRRDKEIKGVEEFLGVLERSTFITIGMVEDGKAYMVPLSYGYRYNNDVIEIYFHSALAGRKIDLLKKNPYVTFTVGRPVLMSLAEQACDYTFFYESLMGEGKVEFIEEHEEKESALGYLMDHTLGKGHEKFDEKGIKGTAVLKMTITEVTGKAARKAGHETDLPPIKF